MLLVPKEQLARVQGFNQALYGFMTIISAPLGAYLLAILPMQGILGIDISTALIAIGIVFFSHIPQPERGESVAFTFWQDFVGRLPLHHHLARTGDHSCVGDGD